MTTWPEPGRCGACTRPARRFPSGRWEHHGRPCAMRSQTMFHAYDITARDLLEFVPDGQPLPQPRGWRLVPTQINDDGIPVELEVQSPAGQASEWDQVREQLRADAEGMDQADTPPDQPRN